MEKENVNEIKYEIWTCAESKKPARQHDGITSLLFGRLLFLTSIKFMEKRKFKYNVIC